MGQNVDVADNHQGQYNANHGYKEVLNRNQFLLLQDEFCRIKDCCYLDHAGATLYSKTQLELAITELQENLFSNPHSRNPSSSITTDATDHVRQRILQHFGTTENEYSVIFTSGATGALKLLGESFSYNGGLFAYLEENHTSVVGMREYLLTNGNGLQHNNSSTNNETAQVKCISKSTMEQLMNSPFVVDTNNVNDMTGSGLSNDRKMVGTVKNALCAFPAQCNFSGFKYPLEWIPKIHKGYLDAMAEVDEFYIQDLKWTDGMKPSSCHPFKWYVVLDAASYVASNKLDLSLHKPDFLSISFYKMFGWPTGLGALIVRNSSEDLLGNKKYFGGGTVNISLPSQPFHVKRSKLHERFEDGTISFLSILGVRHGLDALAKFFPSMDLILFRTFRLSQYLFRNLRDMAYCNGQRVAKIFSDTEYNSEKTQGPIVTFNLLRPNGEMIGYSEMEQIAYLHNVNLRYGCFCNPGACRRHLGLTPEQVLKHYEAGHVCGDMRDIIDGKPTGAIRVSIGYMTTKENIDFLLLLIFNCWIKPYNVNQIPQLKPDIVQIAVSEPGHTPKLQNNRNKLSKLFVYPIKSCAPFEVKSTWTLGPHGLLYDREWLIVNSNGVPLTAKREPRLCLIEPTIDISNRQLILHFRGDDDDVQVTLDVNQISTDFPVKAPLCNSKVCGDSIVGFDCGEIASKWLSRVLDRVDLKLIRMSPDHHRKPRNSLDEISLANQSQFLLLSMASLRQLARELISKRHLSSLNIPTAFNADGSNLTSNHQENLTQTSGNLNYDDGECADLELNTDCISDARNFQNLIIETRVIDSLIGRFRGNLVIDELDSGFPYEEEAWKQIRIGATTFTSGGPCIRCATICMDPLTGAKSSEPFLTLSRMRGGRPNFGVHLYACRFSNHNDNFTVDSYTFLQTLRIGDYCQVLNNEEAGNNKYASAVFETLRNID